MILFCLLVLILVPAFIGASILFVFTMEMVMAGAANQNETKPPELKTGPMTEDELLICPKCEQIREGLSCSTCGTTLIPFDNWEEDWS